MKITPILFVLLTVVQTAIHAQEKPVRPNISLKWTPSGLFLGSIGLHGEYNFGKNSLTAKIGAPVSTHHTFKYDEKDAIFVMKATSFMAGYRTYLSRKHMAGLYFEPYFKYVHHTSEGAGTAMLANEIVTMNFTNDYNGIGMGVQFGAQFLIKKRFVIDFFFFGPEINASRNNFTAIEVSNSSPWTSVHSYQAEQDIREFIHKFPFIRHDMHVMIDRNNKTVRADFKGALPGYRIGLSVGIAL